MHYCTVASLMMHILCVKNPECLFYHMEMVCKMLLNMLQLKSAFYCVYVFIEELHAEACYAECLLQRAALTFLQVGREISSCSLHAQTAA